MLVLGGRGLRRDDVGVTGHRYGLSRRLIQTVGSLVEQKGLVLVVMGATFAMFSHVAPGAQHVAFAWGRWVCITSTVSVYVCKDVRFVWEVCQEQWK